MERFIVAEISKNWPEQYTEPGMPRLLAQRFEAVLNRNAARGYHLVDWRLDRLLNPSDASQLNETIIAIFECDIGDLE